jgi:hypothetical protein
MADKILGLVRIASQVNDSVTLMTSLLGAPAGSVSIPMVGFPSGFQLRPGERVALVQESSGRYAVRPHVKATVVTGAGPGSKNQSYVVFTTDEPGPPNVLATRPL